MKLRFAIAGATAACLALVLSSTVAQKVNASDTTVRFGISARTPKFLLPVLAEREGLFEKHGVSNVKVTFGAGPHSSSALAGGAFDMLMTATPAVDLVGMSSGLVKVLAVAETHSGQSLLGGPGVDAVENLKGKKVAISSGKGSASSMVIAAALRREGLTLDDLQLVVLQDNAASAKAFLSAQVDAAAAFPPNIYKLIDNRPGTKIIDELNDIVLPGAQFSVNDAWAKANPEIVVGLLRGLDDALRLFKKDPEKAKALIADQLNLTDNKTMVDLLYDYSVSHFADNLIVVDEKMESGVLDLLRLNGFAEATEDKIGRIIAPEYGKMAFPAR